MKPENFKSEQGKERMTANKFVKLLKDTIYKTQFRIKLKRLDDWWYFTGESSWQLFPPSFYYTHSAEEIKHITDETLARLRTILAGFEDSSRS